MYPVLFCPLFVLDGDEKRRKGIYSIFVFIDGKRYDFITGVIGFYLWLGQLMPEEQVSLVNALQRRFESASGVREVLFVYNDFKKKTVVRHIEPHRTAFEFYPWVDSED